jgi:hypothetical protein
MVLGSRVRPVHRADNLTAIYDFPDCRLQIYSLHTSHVCRLKVETQLITWLNKYDTDIGEKQAKYEEVLAGFEEEKQQLEKLMVIERLTCKLISCQ